MRIKSEELPDPAFHREQLNMWLDEITNQSPVAGEILRRLISELFKIFPDCPPYTWRFRITKYRSSVFRVHYRPTGRDNDFLIVGSKRLIVLHKFFNEEFRDLFPIRKDFYGQGNGAKIDFSQLGENELIRYLEAIKTMATGSPDWYIRLNKPD